MLSLGRPEPLWHILGSRLQPVKHMRLLSGPGGLQVIRHGLGCAGEGDVLRMLAGRKDDARTYTRTDDHAGRHLSRGRPDGGSRAIIGRRRDAKRWTGMGRG